MKADKFIKECIKDINEEVNFSDTDMLNISEMIKDPFLFSLPEKKKPNNMKPMKKVRTKRNRKKK